MYIKVRRAHAVAFEHPSSQNVLFVCIWSESRCTRYWNMKSYFFICYVKCLLPGKRVSTMTRGRMVISSKKVREE